MRKKTLDNRPFLWGVVFSSFALAILDMMFLKDVFENIFDYELIPAAAISIALATVANVSALLWGRQVGQRKSGKSFMLGWVFLGLIYAAIRCVSIINSVFIDEDFAALNMQEQFEVIMGEALPVLILTISYIGTGSLLRWAGAQLWDKDITDYLQTRKLFKKEHAKIANNRAALMEMLKHLDEYENNYRVLEKQYNKQKENIRKHEYSVMSQIVGKTIADNPEVTPTEANKVMEEVLEERDKYNEKHHTK